MMKSLGTESNTNTKLLAAFVTAMAAGNVQAGEVKLAWDASTSPNVGGYKIYYGQTSKNYTSAVDPGNVLSYTLTTPTSGQYFFALKAYNTDKTIESASFSNEVSAIIPPPATYCTDLTVTPTKMSGTLPSTLQFSINKPDCLGSWRASLSASGMSTAKVLTGNGANFSFAMTKPTTCPTTSNLSATLVDSYGVVKSKSFSIRATNTIGKTTCTGGYQIYNL